MSEETYVCGICGHQVKVKKGEPVPDCCRKTMEPLPYCTAAPNPEAARFGNADEPCDDGTTPEKFKE